jgi:pilus assembly protein Flp/PilA
MLTIWTWMQTKFAAEERGASLVEYALLVVLIAIVAILAIRFAGDQVSTTFSDVGTELSGV